MGRRNADVGSPRPEVALRATSGSAALDSVYQAHHLSSALKVIVLNAVQHEILLSDTAKSNDTS